MINPSARRVSGLACTGRRSIDELLETPSDSERVGHGDQETMATTLLGLLVLLLGSTAVSAAEPSYCNRYADSAIRQYKDAISAGIPGLTPPVWQDDRAVHYGWCLLVSNAEVDAGYRLRQDVLDRYGAPAPGGGAAPRVEPVAMEKLELNPAAVLKTTKQVFCEEYAKTAVTHEGENQARRCKYAGPAWSADYEHHFQWCMRGDNEQQAQRGQDARNQELARCRNGKEVGGAIAAPLPDLDPRIPDIVERWAPVIYQDVDGSFWQADMITSVDYDGNWNGADNTSNLHGTYAVVPAVLYYSLVSTASHDLIGYYLYHAEDTTGLSGGGGHEHDFEGILVAINRKSRQPDALLSNVHGHYVAYIGAGASAPTIIKRSDKYGDPLEELRFVPSSKAPGLRDLGIGVEANTHAVWGRWNSRCVLGGAGEGGGGCDASHGGDGIRYFYGARADVPTRSGQYPDWPSYSYRLEDIQGLWQRALQPKTCGQGQPEATFACQLVDGWSVPWDTMNSSGKDTGDLPWAWGIDRVIGHACQGPSMLLDPAAILTRWFAWQSFSAAYTSNPYLQGLSCN